MEVKTLDDYYFKLVCVNEQDPLAYGLLEDVNLGNLEDVHKYVVEHIKNYSPERIKWMLIPMKKSGVENT